MFPNTTGGQPYFLPQIAIPQILGLIPLSQICKFPNFLGVAVRKSKIRKVLCLIRKLQISKFLKNTTELYLKTILKVFF